MKYDTVCPFCQSGQPLIEEANGGGAHPSQGDYNLCFTCGSWSIIEPNIEGRLRRPDRHEIEAIANDPDCRRISASWIAHS